MTDPTAGTRAWMAPRHLQVNVISLMELFDDDLRAGTRSPLEFLFASHAPSDEARYFVEVYEGLKRCIQDDTR